MNDPRMYPDRPFLAVSAAIIRDGRVLIARRAKPPQLWSLPGGAVEPGETPAQAVTLAWFLEDAARVELAALSAGLADKAPRMNEEQAKNRATWQGRIVERMWDYLTAGDPE